MQQTLVIPDHKAKSNLLECDTFSLAAIKQQQQQKTPKLDHIGLGQYPLVEIWSFKKNKIQTEGVISFVGMNSLACSNLTSQRIMFHKKQHQQHSSAHNKVHYTTASSMEGARCDPI